MDDFVFQSTLTEEQIDENFKSFDFFAALKQGLEEAIAYERGEPKPDTVVHYRAVPDAEAS